MSTPVTSKPACAYPTAQPPAPQNKSNNLGFITSPLSVLRRDIQAAAAIVAALVGFLWRAEFALPEYPFLIVARPLINMPGWVYAFDLVERRSALWFRRPLRCLLLLPTSIAVDEVPQLYRLALDAFRLLQVLACILNQAVQQFSRRDVWRKPLHMPISCSSQIGRNVLVEPHTAPERPKCLLLRCERHLWRLWWHDSRARRSWPCRWPKPRCLRSGSARCSATRWGEVSLRRLRVERRRDRNGLIAGDAVATEKGIGG